MELATGQGADDHGSEAHGRRYATTHRAGADTFTWVFGQGMIGASAMFLVLVWATFVVQGPSGTPKS